jgi:glycosyltransferase involved in cell wall biosynthesis
MNVSLIVTTYNRPDALDRVLASVAGLAVPHPEIVIADDGSDEKTEKLIAEWNKKLPVIHAWQPDDGFRAAMARNLAVEKSSGEYLIFLDGDCLVFPDFIQNHIRLAEPGYLVAGNRILLNPSLTESVLAGKQEPLRWGLKGWLKARVLKRVNRILPMLSVPGQFWRKSRLRKWQGVRSCNLGIYRKDFLSVGGFDESFQGWGHEDADLAIRLIKAGVHRKDGQFATAVLHLWHKENDRSKEQANKQRALAGAKSE